ncbi:MAG: TonB-dependent receptor [Flavobacteriales bacterium]|nr:TonB-dependent receptor [Flavobacteriales bacterium]NCP90353.1 TonB-dependent receptor [Flavobacteriales bacterium]NCQ57799.1 TonB-dependent receptor [Flavobacteriales bacterium]NCT15449.1 TonB-dependent receptor [Flavobacteriales bacterium]PIV93911.1 MAG: TonB-dependent receptor [Flavobacteriaceae bacterium CG17_big_fil_post_rev_8_21_14_2_50_33_15]
MKKKLLIFLFGIFSLVTAFAQQTIIKGSVKDAVTFEPLPDVTITIEETNQSTQTNPKGEFLFSAKVPLGEQVLKVSKLGYATKRYPIVVNSSQTLNITDMTLEFDASSSQDLFTITLSDDELNDDTSGSDNISGLLSSSLDVFQRTAAFEFSSSFFRVRGLDSENGSVLINGIEMNKIYDGRPQWSNWGGLNDMARNQELTTGLTPSAYNFGGVLGTTNINTRASNYRKGGQITYSSSDRSYTNRTMVSYATGLMKDGWSMAFMVARRWGNEGFQDATFYDANSFFASVEKKINDNHSINFTSIYAPNRRGKSSPNTQEVYDLKGIKYNEYWGYQDGDKRNSRIKEVEEPVLMLNHFWDISKKTKLNTNVAYQFGKIGNSRLDNSGGANPSPAYYQKLPSFFLSDPDGPDFGGAFQAEQEFLNNGQIDWDRIYDANITNNASGTYAAYALYEDRNDDKLLTVNSILNTEINNHITINAAVNYKTLKSENFGEIIDLLGSDTGVLNIDSFDNYQYDTQNPDRIVGEGDKYRYNYNLFSDIISGYAQAQFKYNKIDFYISGSLSNTTYQRDGLWEHSRFAGNASFGKGPELSFTGLGAKAGFTYKITGKHLLDFNGGYLTRAPSLRNTFSNSRENNDVVRNITEEKVTALDASYIFRSPILKARLTGYYSKIEDANEVGFFFADGLSGDDIQDNDTSAFVQEILQGVDKKNIGIELGIDAQVTPTIKLKGAASIGQFTYDNNPDLYLTSSSFLTPDGSISYGKANLKDYKLAGGPQRAYSVGFEYRDPDYWWFGATANFFSNTYLDINTLTRTSNFFSDVDGLPFNDYNEELATTLLKQEKFDDYMVINLVGGKSWRIADKYIGFFASVGNLLDKEYRTGGFEQARNANFRELRDDNANPKRVFGNKYWYGRGANYFVNFYVRF